MTRMPIMRFLLTAATAAACLALAAAGPDGAASQASTIVGLRAVGSPARAGSSASRRARPPVTAYVVDQEYNTVVPIQTATNTALSPIRVGISPDAIAITPNGKTAYVLNEASDTVTPIRTATNTALSPIPVGTAPDAIAITPNGKTAYVVNSGSATVTPIRTATNTVLSPIPLGTGPFFAIAITPDGKPPTSPISARIR